MNYRPLSQIQVVCPLVSRASQIDDCRPKHRRILQELNLLGLSVPILVISEIVHRGRDTEEPRDDCRGGESRCTPEQNPNTTQ